MGPRVVASKLERIALQQYDRRMVTCWAAGMGGCSDKQSAEHYVTRGLWSSSEIMISGFDWQKGQPKMLPVATLETKILCERHNNLLSGIDAEATKIFSFSATHFRPHNTASGTDRFRSRFYRRDFTLTANCSSDGV